MNTPELSVLPRDLEFQLHPDALAEGRYYGQRKLANIPEVPLLLAVLESAMHDLSGVVQGETKETRRKIRKETIRWFLGEDSDWPFSFATICETLGIDPSAARKAIFKRAGVKRA